MDIPAGYEKLAIQKKVTLLNLSKDDYDEVDVIVDKNKYQFKLPKTISNSDIFISIPKPKYHICGLSCALKNQFGCNPDNRKDLLHPNLIDVIIALNKIMKPHIILVDGIIINTQKPRNFGLIASSTNVLAVDFIIARILGLDPMKLPLITQSIHEKIGIVDNLLTVGDDLKIICEEYPRVVKPNILQQTIGTTKQFVLNAYLKIIGGIPLF